jgi:hypothetical protein
MGKSWNDAVRPYGPRAGLAGVSRLRASHPGRFAPTLGRSAPVPPAERTRRGINRLRQKPFGSTALAH